MTTEALIEGVNMETAKRLKNWARYFKPSTPLHTCGSVEKNYKSSWRQWLSLSEIPMSTPVDPLDAAIVEKAWSAIPVRRYRQILKLMHMTDLPDHVIAHKAGTKTWKLKHDYASAVAAITQRLDNVV